MSCFKLHFGFLKEVEGFLAAFLWKQEAGKSIHWIAWSKVCRSKKEGGLGIRSLKEFNVALLCKQAWRVSTATVSLVYKLFKAQYFSRTTLVDALGKVLSRMRGGQSCLLDLYCSLDVAGGYTGVGSSIWTADSLLILQPSTF
ncbi:UNVERIFIED_CONTAM: hypothetical protein Sradi_6138800 [Sesamum radiatum]|uniref:Uncharacterized protein n=1 Tax=Sesamum radiatum TaxID=300843 RepID=A0AAW2KJL8_SESRA